MENNWTIGALLRTSTAYWQSCTLQAGVRLGLFTVINDGHHSAADIAAAIRANERGCAYLLNALSAMGLLVKRGERYENGPAARDYLCRRAPGYIGHIILHHHHILDGWAQLHEAVHSGRPVEMRSHGEEVERESFLMGMFNLAMGIAPRLAPMLDLTGCRRLLDLGGGPGTYAIHFCLANPQLTAVIYDRPTTRPFAEQTVSRFGLADRITFHGGDFHRDPIGEDPFDAAWLSHILHGSGPEECRRIIAKTVAAMKPGGLIMIHEFILDDTKDGPEFPALFALNMLVNNEEGRSYSDGEIRAMLAEAGVREISRHPFQGPNDSGIICGRI